MMDTGEVCVMILLTMWLMWHADNLGIEKVRYCDAELQIDLTLVCLFGILHCKRFWVVVTLPLLCQFQGTMLITTETTTQG